MRTANGIKMLEITAHIMGRISNIYPTLIWDNDTVILVDAGYPGQLPQIREAMEKIDVPLDQLNKVVVTHHDIDHIGSLASIQKELPDRVMVLAHEEEKAYIDGEKRPLKLTQLETNLNALPTETKGFYEKLNTAFQNSRVDVDQTLTDGEELPYCGGITVIHTPGHTLGHICLYLKQSRTLIAGDALAVEDGKLVMALAHTNYDMDLCRKSLKKLSKYDIETVICYHGGLNRDQPNRHIATLAQEQ